MPFDFFGIVWSRQRILFVFEHTVEQAHFVDGLGVFVQFVAKMLITAEMVNLFHFADGKPEVFVVQTGERTVQLSDDRTCLPAIVVVNVADMAKSAFYSQHFADDRRRDLIGNARIDNLPEFGDGEFRGFRGQAGSSNNVPAGFVKAVFAAQCGRTVKDEFVLHAVFGHCSVPVQKRL